MLERETGLEISRATLDHDGEEPMTALSRTRGLHPASIASGAASALADVQLSRDPALKNRITLS